MNDIGEVRRLGTGTWLALGSPIVAELASACGFDWLLFDLEHGCLTEAGLLANLQAAKRDGIKLIVRVPDLNMALIARVLDWGAAGIMLPHVSTPDQAEACVRAMNYPPKGDRGYSSSSRSFRYGLDVRQDVQSPLFVPQIEDYAGVVNADSIAAVSGVDVLFVGPADLKLNLSAHQQVKPIAYDEALRHVCLAAENHQKQAGILVKNLDAAIAMKQTGFSCLAIGSDLGFIRDGFSQAIP